MTDVGEAWEHSTVLERPIAMSRISRLAIGLLAVASIVAACGVSDSSTAQAAHPALDCEDEGSGTGNYDVIGPGLETTKAALDDRLGYYQGLYGGEVVELTDNEAALRVDGSNVVVATATPTAEGGFLIQEDYFCNSFQPQQNGPPATEPLITSLSDADAENIVNEFLRFADDPSAEAAERLPVAEEVHLGLGSELHQARSRTQLADPAAWVIHEEYFRAYVGPFSALDVAAEAESTVATVGEHPHCASPPMPPPDDVSHLTRVSVQPDMEEIDSCLQWWTVDFYVNETGQIEAVTLDLWEP